MTRSDLPLDRTGRRTVVVRSPDAYRKPGYPVEEHLEELRGDGHDDWRNAAGDGIAGTALADPPQLRPTPLHPYRGPVRRPPRGSALASLLRTTDAKQIGLMYLVTSFGFFFVGGFLALLMRAELGRPGLQALSTEQYNQAFTMHGTIMLL